MTDICPVENLERLLLSTDGSEFSEGAIREAIRMAKQCNSTLTAMTVIESNPEYAALAPKLLEKAEQAARAHLEMVKARAAREGVDCAVVAREGEDPYHAVAEEAAGAKASLIVMGRRGRKGFKRLMMGSTTARVIGHAPCNVLVVPRAAKVEFKSLLVATDGSKYSAAAASEAIGLARRNKAKLTVVSAVPADIAMPTDVDFVTLNRAKLADAEMQRAEKNAKAVKDAAEKEGIAARAFVMTGKPAEIIIEAARDAQADLIVLGSHGRTGLERLLMGSTTERAIVLASCAVLVVKGAAGRS